MAKLKRHHEAEEKIKEAEEFFRENGSTHEVQAKLILGYAKIALEKRDWVRATEVLEEYVRYNDTDTQEFTQDLGFAYEKLGLMMIYLNELPKAKKYIERGFYVRNQMFKG